MGFDLIKKVLKNGHIIFKNIHKLANKQEFTYYPTKSIRYWYSST